jgi:Tol biopolymer transport system component
VARNGALVDYPDRAVTRPKREEREGALDVTLQDRLDSWKEIASFLGRGVRTVQRWEREEQLPVHRLEHAKRGSVYAIRGELARWWESRQRALSETPPPPTAPPHPAGATPALPPLERVTNTTTMTFSPALSSDARMAVFVSDGGQEGAGMQVWLQQVGGATMRLTSGLHDCADPAFSTDDTTVLFTARGDRMLNVYAVPTLGGEPRLVKRNARSARMSPNGTWLAYLPLDAPRGLRIDRTDGSGERTIAPDLIDISSAAWSPDSAYLLVRGHPDPQFEPDFWIVPLDDRPPANTGIIERFRSRGTVLDAPPVWLRDAVVFAGAGREGSLLWRQRLTPETFRAAGDAEPLTRGTEWVSYPTAAAGRLAFVNAHADVNLWAQEFDSSSGAVRGSPRRLTRGPGVLGHLCLAADGRTLAYFTTRAGLPSVCLRDLENGTERVLPTESPQTAKGFPAISPSGHLLAHGSIVPGPRAMRPIFIVDLTSGASRALVDDCGGRPRQWLDETSILVETFGSRLNAFVVVDATTGGRRPLLGSDSRSTTNPRVSPDGSWIAFDAAFPGGSPTVFVARLDGNAVAESDWIVVAENGSHSFWSRDGGTLYYLATTPNRDLRSVVYGQPLNPATGEPEGMPFVAVTLSEALVPTFLPGTAPVVARDRIVLVLADVRGDIWMMDLAATTSSP